MLKIKLFIALLLVSMPALAQEKSVAGDLTGDWNGVIVAGTQSMGITLIIKSNPDTISATAIDEGGATVAVSNLVVTPDNSISFVAKNENMELSFEGKVSKSFGADFSNLIAGKVAVGGAKTDFTMERIYSGGTSLKTAAEYLTRGRGHLEKRDWLKGIGDLTEAIKLEPKSTRAYWLRGYAYRELGFQQRLSLVALAGLGIKPNYTSVKLKLHWSIVDLTRSIKLEPKNATLWYNRGLTYIAKYDLPDGDLDDCRKAISDYSEAISLSPKTRDFYIDRAYAYRKLGMVDKATADQQKALELDVRE